ncbi:MAG: outer membrane protein assembly factor BamA, partial [bacterium]
MRRILLITIVIYLAIGVGTLWAEVMKPLLDLSGVPIVTLDFEGAEISKDEFSALLSMSIGDPLVPARVNESVVNLYRSGRFESVSVFARQVQGGVKILFRLQHKRWLGQVRFEGNLSLSNGDLTRKILLRRDEEVNLEDLEKNRKMIEDYYAFRGFTQAQIAYRTEADELLRINLVFQIIEGPQSRVREILLQGNMKISRFRFLNLLSTRLGGKFDGRRSDRDKEKISRYLEKKGYYFAEVDYSMKRIPGEEVGVAVTVSVDTGPHYLLNVRTRGDHKTKKLNKWVREAFMDEKTRKAAMEVSAARIRDYFLDFGYPFVSMEWSNEGDEAGDVNLTLSIDEGWFSKVGEISVTGVEAFEAQDIGNALGILTGESFVRSGLEAGIKNLEGIYRERGYLSADVSLEPLNFLPSDGERRVPVRITVNEGIQTKIGSIRINGGIYPEDEVRDIMGLNVGDPFVPENLVRGREALLDRFSRDAYLYGSVAVNEPLVSSSRRVDIVVDLSEGPLVRLGSVVIIGNSEVNTKIIRLAIDLDRGETLTLAKILEAQERIYKLGVFSSVEIRLAEPEVESQVKDLIVKVKERKRYVIGLKVGYGNEDLLRGEVSLTNRNVSDMARSLKLRLKGSSRENLESITYHQPWFLGRNIEFSVSLNNLLEVRESFTRDTEAVSINLKKEVSKNTTARLEYSFESLELSGVSPGAQLSSEDEGQTDVGAIIPEIIHDSRDDFFEPTRGVLSNIRLEIASKALVSKAQFYKVEAGSRRYLSIGDNMIVAMILRLGVVKSYGDSDEVIISKRFFMGGLKSVRGYSLDDLGPKDSTGEPIGGNYMINFNTELRRTMYRSIKGVVFLDTGSLWLDQAPYNDTTLRVSAGIGLRWSSPIGPLSLDYGYKLNPATEEEEKSRI